MLLGNSILIFLDGIRELMHMTSIGHRTQQEKIRGKIFGTEKGNKKGRIERL